MWFLSMPQANNLFIKETQNIIPFKFSVLFVVFFSVDSSVPNNLKDFWPHVGYVVGGAVVVDIF